jgi:hypothetical protein
MAMPDVEIEYPLPDPIDEIIGSIDQEPCCQVCGCTAAHPCLTDLGPCFFVAPDLCSRCANAEDPET